MKNIFTIFAYMNNYNFTFNTLYTGIWHCSDSDIEIPGTLNLYDHNIVLELFTNSNVDDIMRTRKEIRGLAGYNNNNYHFILRGAYLISHTYSVICHYTFEIEEIIISQEEISSFDNVKNICIRTKLADSWLCSQLRKSYDIKSFDDLSHCTVFKFTHQDDIILYDNDNYRVSISPVYHKNYAMTSVGFDSTAFINIDFKNDETTIEICDDIVKIVSNFFILIWNKTFEPDFISYTTVDVEYIKKISDRFSYVYLDHNKDYSIYTDFEDFNGWTTIKDMLGKWLLIYEKYNNALDTYFEIISNTRNAPNTLLRSFISVLETLGQDFKAPKVPLHPENKRRIFLKEICDKYHISNEDWIRIEQKFLMEKDKSMKSNLNELVCSLKDIIPNNIDQDFIEKAINTRNNITHIKNQVSNSFKRDEFKMVNLNLSRLIRAFLLRKIDAPDIVIKKIIKYRW